MQLNPHMLYCYNSNPNDITSMLNYLYMIDDKRAFIFPQFWIRGKNTADVRKIVNSRTGNLRPVSNYPCIIYPCLIYQNEEYVCLGLTTPTQAIALRPELIDIMQDVDVKILPRFQRGKSYTNKYTGKQYLFRHIDSISIDTFVFIECETRKVRCFKGENMEGFIA